MKKLTDYLAELDSTGELDMKLMTIVAEQDNDDIVMWNTEDDRWSRRAKHPLRVNEVSTNPVIYWEKGEIALYKLQQVEISIPKGPNGTIGIVVEGHTKMVLSDRLSKIDESVMGMMQPINPLNRIMQLAGINTPVDADSKDIDIHETVDDVVLEADSTNMFEQLFRANLNGEYKNNPDAARLATVGEVMVGLGTQVQQLQGKLTPDLENKINAAVGLGAALITAAKGMTTAQ